ncbi:MAG: carboxypeptidase-like regulatory domain-containing protein [Deltaproteobacteria bacterium]|nr:carboxypeptidase-like regulatory domain-containing protein [Deltaproteobacteria bacterium]
MKRRSPLVLSLLLLSALGAPACPGCLGGKAEVVGWVHDEGGPVEGVVVRGGAKEVVTDADGLFRARVRRGGDLLTFESEGHAPAYRPVAPGGAEWATELVELASRESFTVDPAAGDARLSSGPFDEILIRIPEGAVETSAPYEALVAYYPIFGGAQFPPVPLLGKEGKDLLPLESFGMLELTLRCGDEACPLARDASITARLPTVGNDPATATLFTADPKEGVWLPEGEVTNDGAFWNLTLDHLSWKNVDRFLKVPEAEQACLKIVVRSYTGRPLAGAKVQAGWGPGYRQRVEGSTESDGVLCEERFPLGADLQVSAYHFLRPAAKAPVSTQLTVTPSAQGASCEDEACQEIVLTLACGQELTCGEGYTCASGECVEERGPGKLKVTFENADAAENIHLWGPGETIDAGNRLAPGKDDRRVFEAAPGDTPLFHAGRDGQTLASLACLAVEIPNSEARLVWDGAGLSCVGF